MRSSIFNSSATAIAAFFLTFAFLAGTWEAIVRRHYNPPVHIDYQNVAGQSDVFSYLDKERAWVIFGNCLVLNGFSPSRMLKYMHARRPNAVLPMIFNISQHEAPPQAFLAYMKNATYYPEGIIFNVSSWLNTDNYAAGAERLRNIDPLDLIEKKKHAPRNTAMPGGQRGKEPRDALKTSVENALRDGMNSLLKFTEKRYHLFDYAVFAWTLLRTGDLRESLYNIQLQSWFTIRSVEKDPFGYMAFVVDYSDSWSGGVDAMARKQLIRMKLGNFLTDRYWSRLEELLREFKRHGTRIVIVRMPEHPDIFRFNEERYRLGARGSELAVSLGAKWIDFNDAIVGDVVLYDAVHPDHDTSLRLSDELAKQLSRTGLLFDGQEGDGASVNSDQAAGAPKRESQTTK